MIYHRPIFRTMGDTALNIEFGDETSIALNFRILALDIAIRAHPPKGLLETNPQVRSLGIVYNPLVTMRDKLTAALKEMIASQDEVKTLPSRRMTIPALYDDPWSRDCAAAFGVRDNMEYIAEFNGLTPGEVIEAHTACDYWVTGVGFVPGAFMSYAMDPRRRIGAPLYRTPRSWTPARRSLSLPSGSRLRQQPPQAATWAGCRLMISIPKLRRPCVTCPARACRTPSS